MLNRDFWLLLLIPFIVFILLLGQLKRLVAINAQSLSYLSQIAKYGWQESESPPLGSHPRSLFWTTIQALNTENGQEALAYIQMLEMESVDYPVALRARALAMVDRFPDAVIIWKSSGYTEELINAGDIAVKDERFDEALLAYSAAYEVNPEFSASRLARFYWLQKENPTTAKDILSEALTIYPRSRYRLAWFLQLANIETANENHSEAIALLEQAIEENTGDIHVHIELGWAYYRQNRSFDKAEQQFKKAIEINRSRGDGYFAMAQLLALNQSCAIADPWFAKAIELTPNLRSWYIAWANCIRGEGDLIRSLVLYELAIERFPDYASAYYEMAWALYLDDQIDSALASIKQAIAMSTLPPLDYLLRLAVIYENSGQCQQALDTYTQILEINPQSNTGQQAVDRLGICR
jgi:tetratricopeptide (TPR) repeat protein